MCNVFVYFYLFVVFCPRDLFLFSFFRAIIDLKKGTLLKAFNLTFKGLTRWVHKPPRIRRENILVPQQKKGSLRSRKRPNESTSTLSFHSSRWQSLRVGFLPSSFEGRGGGILKYSTRVDLSVGSPHIWDSAYHFSIDVAEIYAQRWNVSRNFGRSFCLFARFSV